MNDNADDRVARIAAARARVARMAAAAEKAGREIEMAEMDETGAWLALQEARRQGVLRAAAWWEAEAELEAEDAPERGGKDGET